MIGALLLLVTQAGNEPSGPDPSKADPSKGMVEIFKRPEFDRSPGWWSRMWSAIGRFFDSLSFSWLGPVGQFLLWIVLIIAAIALGAFLWRAWRSRGPRRGRRRKEADDIVPIDIDTLTDPGDLRSERRAFEEQQDYKQAILYRYRELVATLMLARLVSTEPGRTTGELRIDLAGSAPTARRSFGEATDIFEVAWYSDQPSTPESLRRLDQLAAATLTEAGAGARDGAGA